MNKDEIINESWKDSINDNPQDACEREESFQAFAGNYFIILISEDLGNDHTGCSVSWETVVI